MKRYFDLDKWIFSIAVIIGIAMCVVSGQPPVHLGELLRAHSLTNRPPELKHRSGLTNLDLEIPQLISVHHAYIIKNIPDGRMPVRCWQMTARDATNTLWLTTNRDNLMLIEIK